MYLIAAVITLIFNPIAELAIPTAIGAKKAKAENITYPVTIETKIRTCSM